MTRSAAITYDGLPISSGGGHALRTHGFRAGLEAVQTFVRSVSTKSNPIELILEVISSDDVPASFSAPLISEFDARFVKLVGRSIGSHIGHQWTISPDALDELTSRFSEVAVLPQAGYAGPSVVIHAKWELDLVGLPSGGKLPFQGREEYLGFSTGFQQYLGESIIYARISDRTTANLFLSLPFEEISDAAQYVADIIKPAFPARLSSNHWKIWRLTKAKAGYIGRKILGVVN